MMFRQNIESSVRSRELSRLLMQYQQLAASNPQQLQLLIPRGEIWRFFVDGILQSGDSYLTKLIKSKNKKDELQSYMMFNDDEMAKARRTDIIKLNKGWLLFESREPGYMRALYGAFHLMFTESKELTLDYILKLHQYATASVRRTNYSDKRYHSMPGKLRDDGNCGYGLTPDNTTRDGLRELCGELQPYFFLVIDGLEIAPDSLAALRRGECNPSGRRFANNYPDYFKRLVAANTINELSDVVFDIIEHSDEVNVRYHSMQMSDPSRELKRHALRHIQEFNDSIRRADTPIGKLYCICLLVRRLEQLHMFIDANCRTFCMLLLPHLLVNNGFPLCILDDPNCFDAYSLDELVGEVLDGMDNVFELIKAGDLYDVHTSEVTKRLDKPNSLGVKREHVDQLDAIEDRLRRRVEMKLSEKKRKVEGRITNP